MSTPNFSLWKLLEFLDMQKAPVPMVVTAIPNTRNDKNAQTLNLSTRFRLPRLLVLLQAKAQAYGSLAPLEGEREEQSF